MHSAPLIAVLDVGKTHAKLLLVDRARGEAAATAQRERRSIETAALRQLDLEATWLWLLDALGLAPLGRSRERADEPGLPYRPVAAARRDPLAAPPARAGAGAMATLEAVAPLDAPALAAYRAR